MKFGRSQHWKNWIEQPPPQSDAPISIRRTNKSHEDVVLLEQLHPCLDVSDLWWRPWPEDEDLMINIRLVQIIAAPWVSEAGEITYSLYGLTKDGRVFRNQVSGWRAISMNVVDPESWSGPPKKRQHK